MRNAYLNAQAIAAEQQALGPVRCPADSAIAALLLDACTDKEMALAMGLTFKAIQRRVLAMRRRIGARNRVGLALAIRELL